MTTEPAERAELPATRERFVNDTGHFLFKATEYPEAVPA